MKTAGRLIAPLLALLVLAAPAAAELKKFAEGYASGDTASAEAEGDARRPAKIVVKVRTDPEQEIKVKWEMTCTKKSKEASSHGGFTETTPIRRTLYIPLNDPKSCRVSARSELNESGSLYIALFKKTQS